MVQSLSNFPSPEPLWDQLPQPEVPVDDRSDIGLSFDIGMHQMRGVPAWATGVGASLFEKAGFKDSALRMRVSALEQAQDMAYDISQLDALYDGPNSWAEAQAEGTLGSYALWGINEAVKQVPNLAVMALTAFATGGIGTIAQLTGRAALAGMLAKMPYAAGNAVRGGQIAGVALGSAALNTGEIYSSALLETGESNPGITGLAGLLAGSLDLWPGSKVIRAMGKSKDLGSHIANKFLRDKPFQSRFYRALELGATEGLVEDIQTVIEGVTVNYLKDNGLEEEFVNKAYGIFPMTASQQAERIEARAAGGLLGTLLGGFGRTSTPRYSDKLPKQLSVTEDAVNALTGPITPTFGEGVAPTYDETTTVGYAGTQFPAGAPRRRPGFATRAAPEGTIALEASLGAPPMQVAPLVSSQARDIEGTVLPTEQVAQMGGVISPARLRRRGVEPLSSKEGRTLGAREERKAERALTRAVEKEKTAEEIRIAEAKAMKTMDAGLAKDVAETGDTGKGTVSVAYGEKESDLAPKESAAQEADYTLVDYGRVPGTVEYREDVKAARESILSDWWEGINEAQKKEIGGNTAVELIVGGYGKEGFGSLNKRELGEVLKAVGLKVGGTAEARRERLEALVGDKLQVAVEEKNRLAEQVSEEEAWISVQKSLRDNEQTLLESLKEGEVVAAGREEAAVEAAEGRADALQEATDEAQVSVEKRKLITKRKLGPASRVRTLKKPSRIIQNEIEKSAKPLEQFTEPELNALLDKVDLDYTGLSREEKIDALNRSIAVSKVIKRRKIGGDVSSPVVEAEERTEWSPEILAFTEGKPPTDATTLKEFFNTIEYYKMLAGEKYNRLFRLGEFDDNLPKQSSEKFLTAVFADEAKKATFVQQGGPSITPKQIYNLEYYLTNKKVPVPSWMEIKDYSQGELEVTLAELRDAINLRIATKKARSIYEKEQKDLKDKGEKEGKAWAKLSQKEREFRIGKIKKVEIVSFDQSGRYVVNETPDDQVVWGFGNRDKQTRNIYRGEPYRTPLPPAEVKTIEAYDNLSEEERKDFLSSFFSERVSDREARGIKGEALSLGKRLVLYDHGDTKVDEQAFDDSRSVRIHLGLRDVLSMTARVFDLKESGRFSPKEIVDVVKEETGHAIIEEDIANVTGKTKDGIPLLWLLRLAQTENISIGAITKTKAKDPSFISLSGLEENIAVEDGKQVLFNDSFLQDFDQESILLNAKEISEEEQYAADKLKGVRDRVVWIINTTPSKPDRTLKGGGVNPEYQSLLDQAYDLAVEEASRDISFEGDITGEQNISKAQERLRDLASENKDYLFNDPKGSSLTPKLKLGKDITVGQIYNSIRMSGRDKGSEESTRTFISRVSQPPAMTKEVAKGTKVTLTPNFHSDEIKKSITPLVKRFGNIIKEGPSEKASKEGAAILGKIENAVRDILSREYNVEDVKDGKLSLRETGGSQSKVEASVKDSVVLKYSEESIERNAVQKVLIGDTKEEISDQRERRQTIGRRKEIINRINREFAVQQNVADLVVENESTSTKQSRLLLARAENLLPKFTTNKSLAALLQGSEEINHQRKQKILSALYAEGLISKTTYDERRAKIEADLQALTPSVLSDLLEDRQKIQLINELRFRNGKFVPVEDLSEASIRRVGKSLGVVFHKKSSIEVTYKRIQKIFKETSARLTKAEEEKPDAFYTAVSLDYPRIWDTKPWVFVKTNATGEMTPAARASKKELKGGKWIETAPLITWKNKYGLVITQMRLTTTLERTPSGRFASAKEKDAAWEWEYVYEVYDPYNIRNVSSGENIFTTKAEAEKVFQRSNLYKLGQDVVVSPEQMGEEMAEKRRLSRATAARKELAELEVLQANSKVSQPPAVIIEEIVQDKASDDVKRSIALESSFQDSGLMPQYIIADAEETGIGVDALMKRMSEAFGKRALNFIHVVKSQDQLPTHLQDSSKRIRAVAFNTDVWFVADNITESRVIPLVLHEIGVHGFQSIMGKRLYQKLMGAVAMLANTDGNVGAVYERLAKEFPEANESWLVEETMGYIVENQAVEQNAFWRTLIDHILYGIARLKLFLNPKWIKSSDLLVLAKAAVKSYREASKVEQYTFIANELNAPMYSSSDTWNGRSDEENEVQQSLHDSGQVAGSMNKGFLGDWILRDMPRARTFLENFLVVRNITQDPEMEVGGRRIRRVAGQDYQVFVGDNVKRWFHNYFNDIETLEHSIERRGGKVSIKNMASLAHGKYKNFVNYKRRSFHDEYVKRLSDYMQDHKVDGEDLHNYLYARHAPQANRKLKETKGVVDGSGISNAVAENMLVVLKKKLTTEQWANLQRSAEMVYTINNYRIILLRDEGLIGEKDLELWLADKKYNETYVPLREKGDTISDELFGETLSPSPISVQGLESKYRTGRYSPAGNTWAWSVMQVDFAIDRAEKNKVVKAFARMVRENEDDLKKDIQVLSPDSFKRAKEFESGEVLMEGLYSNMVTDPAHHITFKVDGETYHIISRDKRIGEAFNRSNMNDSGAMMQLFAQVNRFFSAIHTTLSPEFILTNFIRDIQTGLTNLQSELKEGSIRKISNPNQLTKQVIKDLKVAGFGLKEFIRDKKTDSEWAKMAELFSENGGRIDFFAFRDAREFEKSLNVYIKDTTPNGARRFRNKVLEFMGDYNAVFENTIRLSVFKNAREALIENGMTEIEANMKSADIARNLTVNFSNKGEKTQAFNSLYLFFNAGVQGTVRLLQAVMRRAPSYDEEGRMVGTKGFTRVQKIMGSIALFGFSNGIINSLLAGDDEDGVNRYRQIDINQRQRQMHIYLPGFDTFMKIPLPYGYNIPYVLGDTVAAMMMGHVGPGKASLNLLNASVESFVPFSWGGSDTVIGTAVKTVTPQFLDPALDLAMNESFFGGPIYKDPAYGSADPPSERYWSNTGGTFKTISRALNALTGGSKVEAGFASLEPDILEFFWETYAGSAGRFVERTTDLVWGIGPGRITHKETGDLNWSKIPLGRRFFSDATAAKRGFRYEKYAEYVSAIRIADGVSTGIRRTYGLGSEWNSFKKGEDYKLSQLNGLKKSTEGAITKLYKARAAINRNRMMSSDAKEKRIDVLKERMNKLRDRLINKVDEVLGEG